MAFQVRGGGSSVPACLSLTLWQCLASCDSQEPASLESQLAGGQRGPPPGPGHTQGLLLEKNQPLQLLRWICIMRVFYAHGGLRMTDGERTGGGRTPRNLGRCGPQALSDPHRSRGPTWRQLWAVQCRCGVTKWTQHGQGPAPSRSNSSSLANGPLASAGYPSFRGPSPLCSGPTPAALSEEGCEGSTGDPGRAPGEGWRRAQCLVRARQTVAVFETRGRRVYVTNEAVDGGWRYCLRAAS